MSHAAVADLAQCIPTLQRYARLLARNVVDADDLVQESLVRMIVRVSDGGPISNPRAYLFTILRNCHREQRTRVARRNDVAIDEVADSIACEPRQRWQLELGDVADAITRLPKEQREVLVLVGIEGLTYGEASRAIDAPIGTVMSRLSRARVALRHSLAGANGWHASLQNGRGARSPLRPAHGGSS